MLRLPRHSSVRLARSLRDPSALGTAAARPCPTLQRGFAASRPHEHCDDAAEPVVRLAAAASTSDEQQRSLLPFRRLNVDRRRTAAAGVGGGLVVRPLAAAATTRQCWRGLATSGKGGKQQGGGGDEEGMFDRLKKTFAEEIEKVQSSCYWNRRLQPQKRCYCGIARCKRSSRSLLPLCV